jgi:hypothetical protein
MRDIASPVLREFRECLARRVDAGLPVTFWWRDDDLVASSDEFSRVTQLSRRTGILPLISVIPAEADPGLGCLAAEFPDIVFCQHGYAHLNHQVGDEPKSEFGEARGGAAVRADLAAGRERMELIFQGRHAPVFVPPWNRFSPEYAAILVDEMFSGFSGYHGEPAKPKHEKLRCVDVDIDVLNWNEPRAVIDIDKLITRLTGTISSADARTEPFGILTHHRVINPQSWEAIEVVLSLVTAVPGAKWLSPRELFSLE